MTSPHHSHVNLSSANEILEVQVMDELILKVIQIHKISEKSKKNNGAEHKKKLMKYPK